MLAKILFTFFAALFIQFNAHSQGIEFFHGSWEEALNMSKEQGKPIFVDAYAVWCGPCKRMAATTFKDEKVGEFYNANFINMKLDMERGMGRTFRSKYPVSAFPTLYYIDSEGKVLHKEKGGRDSDAFIKLGEFALRKVDDSAEFIRKYKEGDRKPATVYEYLKSLNKRREPSLKVANEYLDTQDDLTTDFNRQFILEAVTEADSRIFEMLMDDYKGIVKLATEEVVHEKVARACDATVEKAIEYESEMLLEEAKDKMKTLMPEQAEAFGLKADLKYSYNMRDVDAYVSSAKKYAKFTDASLKALSPIIENLSETFGYDANAMKLAIQITEKRVKDTDDSEAYLFYAKLLQKDKQMDEARKAAQRAAKLAESEKEKLASEKFLQDLAKG